MSLSQSTYSVKCRPHSRGETVKPDGNSSNPAWNSPKAKVPWDNLQFKQSSPRPRVLSKPDSHPDESTLDKLGHSQESPSSRSHGNAKPQEPAFMSTLPAWKQPMRIAMHTHAQRPWTVACAPGKRENASRANRYNRVWATDSQIQGRWNRTLKQEHYDKQDREMMSKKPHDEKFGVMTNRKYWTHLDGQGTLMGGLDKLEVVPPRSTGLHLKSGLYKGKFENIRHTQAVCMKKALDDSIVTLNPAKQRVYMVDSRLPFDNRLHDDVIQAQMKDDIDAQQIGFDLFRPKNTMSCPQLGVDFCNR